MDRLALSTAKRYGLRPHAHIDSSIEGPHCCHDDGRRVLKREIIMSPSRSPNFDTPAYLIAIHHR